MLANRIGTKRGGGAAAGLLTGGFFREALAGAGCFVVAGSLQDMLPCLAGSPRLAGPAN